jgi:outer membrane protein assembly factor BamB
VSTAAVHQGRVYITETNGYLHCVDAATGNRIWVYDLKSSVLGSPYLVDGRVFVAADDGQVQVFAHERAARVLAMVDMEERICTTPAAAKGTLYLATDSKLFAIGSR